jgi:hypothetical protein
MNFTTTSAAVIVIVIIITVPPAAKAFCPAQISACSRKGLHYNKIEKRREFDFRRFYLQVVGGAARNLTKIIGESTELLLLPLLLFYYYCLVILGGEEGELEDQI